MTSWEEYIKSNILEFRKRYKMLREEKKKLVEKSKEASLTSLNKPCQVVVIDFAEPYPKCFLVLHNEKYPDLKTVVFENVVYEIFYSKILKEPKLLELLDVKELKQITKRMKTEIRYFISAKREDKWTWSVEWFEKSSLILCAYDLRSTLKLNEFSGLSVSLMMHSLERSLREKQRKKIEETVNDIKRDAEEIPVIELKTKIIEATERLEDQMKQIDKKLEKEVSGVRRLIGTSEKYLDWKAFTTDFEYLKETHIAKDVFDAHIKRLDEKIEKGLEALNTRIEDLKAIKFWSKRTLLEVALFIWGAVVTLYVAGVIKF